MTGNEGVSSKDSPPPIQLYFSFFILLSTSSTLLMLPPVAYGIPPSHNTRYLPSSALSLPLLSVSALFSISLCPVPSLLSFIFSPTCGFALHPSVLLPSLSSSSVIPHSHMVSLFGSVCVWCYPEFTGAPCLIYVCFAARDRDNMYVCMCVCVSASLWVACLRLFLCVHVCVVSSAGQQQVMQQFQL